MAPGPDGTLLVSIPTLTGSVLVLLDADGAPLPGWPIATDDWCTLLLPVDDGSVRVVCDPPGFETPQDVSALAIGAGGRSLVGWPVALGSDLQFDGRMVGDELTLVGGRYADVPRVWAQTVEADGTIRRGADAPHECCYGWAVAHDGTAYGTNSTAEAPHDSRITAVGPDGELAGWPVGIEGRTSAPAIGVDGRVVVAVGPAGGGSTGVLAFDRSGKSASASADVPITTVNPLGTGDSDCGTGYVPQSPIISNDGTIFVYSHLENSVIALEPSLATKAGWPFEAATRLQYQYYMDPTSELSCGSYASPAVGPDSTLYLSLSARNETLGGSLVAVGPTGRERDGWPVALTRPGAEFWTVAVGSDGTVFALVVEPEAGEEFSASILAIAPDSTVLYTTTIIEP